jgi:hypothetical protein
MARSSAATAVAAELAGGDSKAWDIGAETFN